MQPGPHPMRSFLLATCASASLLMGALLVPDLAAAAPAPSIVPDAAAPQGKLDSVVKPRAYRLDFTVLPDKPRFSGHTDIDITLNGETKSFYMHGRDLKISKA